MNSLERYKNPAKVAADRERELGTEFEKTRKEYA